MAVDEEASQILHGVELPLQHLLSPLAHQVAGRKPNILLDSTQLAHGFNDIALVLLEQERFPPHVTDTSRGGKSGV